MVKDTTDNITDKIKDKKNTVKDIPQENKNKELIIIMAAILIIAAIMIPYGIINANNDIKGKYLTSLPVKYVWNNTTLKYYPSESASVECSNERLWNLKTRINKDGFRGEDVPENKTIIGIFGDSFVYGDCLSDNQTISSYLERRLKNEYGSDYEVHSFAIPSYGFNSTTEILKDMTAKYHIKYSIFYFMPADDLIGCDGSCRMVLRQTNREKSDDLEKNIGKYVLDEVSHYKEKLIAFEPYLKSRILDRDILDKTKIIFYIVDEDPKEINQILDKYDIIYIEPVLRNTSKYLVPYDGHPNAEYNSVVSEIFARKISELEKSDRNNSKYNTTK